MEPITVNYKVLDPRAKVPAYATPGSAAADLCAVLDEPLPPAKHVFTHKIWKLGGWKGTAPACALPEGYVWAAPEDLAEVYPVPNAFGAYVKAK